ncbi:MAG: ATP-binding protein [Prolixibacteraceae bacterium]|nr:ATP-binding protein [Prolixibacteraceae bacterium]
MTKPEIIVITGAESTGKSTLTKALADYFAVPYAHEFAREYVENLPGKYSYTDVEKIGKEQVKQLRTLINSNAPFVFIDTWLIITKVWFEVVFNKVPQWIETELRSTPIDLFLVCDTDLPWIADPVRENGGENRLKLQNKYIDNIKKYNFEYNLVTGKNEERFKNSLKILKSLK